MKKSERIDSLNSLRGIAAACVVISHFYGLFWTKSDVISGFIKVPYSVNGITPTYISWFKFHEYADWGMFGVALFFLISGFVIPFSISKTSTKDFVKSRFMRIWPVYAAGLSISLLVLLTSVGATNWPFPLSHVIIHYLPGLRDILGTTNIDGIIWTLEIEVKFYLICILIAPLIRQGSIKTFIAPALIVALSAATWFLVDPTFESVLGRMMFAGLVIIFMFIGVTFYYARAGILSRRNAVLICMTLFFAFAALMPITPGMPRYFIWSFAAALLVFSISFAWPWLFKKRATTDFLAKISYPLYATHAVFGYTLLAVMIESSVDPNLALLSATVASVALAYLLHLIVEVPTMSKRTNASKPQKLGQPA